MIAKSIVPDGTPPAQAPTHVWIDGSRYGRIVYPAIAARPCAFCDTPPGQYHALLCVAEDCPACGAQFPQCRCEHTWHAADVPVAPDSAPPSAPDLDAARHALLAAVEASIRAEVTEAGAWRDVTEAQRTGVDLHKTAEAWRAIDHAPIKRALTDAQAVHRAAFLAAGCPPLGARIPARLPFTLDGPDVAAGYDPHEGDK